MIKIQFANIDHSSQTIFERELNEIQGIQVEKIEQSGFDGVEIIYYFISAGGAVGLITSIKEVIIKTIERNKDNIIKINGIELKGYSTKDAMALLDKILDKNND